MQQNRIRRALSQATRNWPLNICIVLVGVLPAQSQWVINTIAGNGNATYAGDGGLATAASLNHPKAMAVEQRGDLYIADSDNSRIRRVASNGIISTVAGNGTFGASGDGGQAVAASLSDDLGVALDGGGNVYVADSSNHRVRMVTTSGIITTIAGTGQQGSSGDGGPATAALINRPVALIVDSGGGLYICDSSDHRIRRVSPSGIITAFAGNGIGTYSGDGGPATSASLNFPLGITLD